MARTMRFSYQMMYGDYPITSPKELLFEIEEDEYEMLLQACEEGYAFEDFPGFSDLKRDLIYEIQDAEADNPHLQRLANLFPEQNAFDLVNIRLNWSGSLHFDENP